MTHNTVPDHSSSTCVLASRRERSGQASRARSPRPVGSAGLRPSSSEPWISYRSPVSTRSRSRLAAPPAGPAPRRRPGESTGRPGRRIRRPGRDGPTVGPHRSRPARRSAVSRGGPVGRGGEQAARRSGVPVRSSTVRCRSASRPRSGRGGEQAQLETASRSRARRNPPGHRRDPDPDQARHPGGDQQHRDRDVHEQCPHPRPGAAPITPASGPASTSPVAAAAASRQPAPAAAVIDRALGVSAAAAAGRADDLGGHLRLPQCDPPGRQLQQPFV